LYLLSGVMPRQNSESPGTASQQLRKFARILLLTVEFILAV